MVAPALVELDCDRSGLRGRWSSTDWLLKLPQLPQQRRLGNDYLIRQRLGCLAIRITLCKFYHLGGWTPPAKASRSVLIGGYR